MLPQEAVSAIFPNVWAARSKKDLDGTQMGIKRFHVNMV